MGARKARSPKSAVSMYCVKCKTKAPVAKPKVVRVGKRKAYTAVHKCGTKMYRFGA